MDMMKQMYDEGDDLPHLATGVLKRKGCSSARRTTAHRVTPTPERPNVST